MNDELLFDRIASHDGPAAPDGAFEDRLYSILQQETRRWRSLRPALLLTATLVLVLTTTAAIAVGSGVIAPPWVNPLLIPQPSTASSSLSPTGQPEASPASGKLGAYPSGSPWVAAGSHSVTVDGLLLSFDMPNGDWQGHGPFYLAKDTYGPQGAEAIILWMTLPDTLPAPGVGGPIFHGSYVLCRELLGSSPGSSSLADVATVMSTVAGTSRVSGPSDVTVGGRAAKHFSLFATYDVMSNASTCSPGLFMSWQDPTGGAMWGTSVIPGDTFRVWIVDVDGKRLLIEAASHWNADASIGEEIQQIIDSIRFE